MFRPIITLFDHVMRASILSPLLNRDGKWYMASCDAMCRVQSQFNCPNRTCDIWARTTFCVSVCFGRPFIIKFLLTD